MTQCLGWSFQIDEQVLQALPNDIRSNIEEALQRKREKSVNETCDRPGEAERCQVTELCCTDDGEQPGCSHWTTTDAAAESAASASLKCRVSLPSYSQVIFVARWTLLVDQVEPIG